MHWLLPNLWLVKVTPLCPEDMIACMALTTTAGLPLAILFEKCIVFMCLLGSHFGGLDQELKTWVAQGQCGERMSSVSSSVFWQELHNLEKLLIQCDCIKFYTSNSSWHVPCKH